MLAVAGLLLALAVAGIVAWGGLSLLIGLICGVVGLGLGGLWCCPSLRGTEPSRSSTRTGAGRLVLAYAPRVSPSTSAEHAHLPRARGLCSSSSRHARLCSAGCRWSVTPTGVEPSTVTLPFRRSVRGHVAQFEDMKWCEATQGLQRSHSKADTEAAPSRGRTSRCWQPSHAQISAIGRRVGAPQSAQGSPRSTSTTTKPGLEHCGQRLLATRTKSATARSMLRIRVGFRCARMSVSSHASPCAAR